MSTRQMRKLQKQRELEKAKELPQEEEEESSGEELQRAQQRGSLFAALGGDDDADEDEEEQEPEPEPEPVKEEEDEEDAKPVSTGKSKKKKKKKKKQKKPAEATQPQPQDEAPEEEDEIDKAIKELNISPRKDTPSASSSAVPSVSPRNALFAVNPNHLKAVNEMRALFGRDVIEFATAEEESERRRQAHNQPGRREVDLETFLRGPPGQKKLPEVSLRRNFFIQGREHWPLATSGGLVMRELRRVGKEGPAEFAWVHEGEYDAAEVFFFQCVQLGDPMRMVHLLGQLPYHVSTLLQVSSVAKQDQNMALAAELCERALFAFGRVTTTTFRRDVQLGLARLDFRRPENRQFWLAGYHYIKSLIRKGTYKTAFEWSKMLVGLNTRDPYAMRYFLIPLALRARESKWLLDVLDGLPGMLVDDHDSQYLRQSAVLAHLQLGQTDAARETLIKGLQTVPWLYSTLFQELNLDTPPSIWGITTDSDKSRQFWVKLYISQMKDLWNTPQNVGFLQDVAKSIEKVNVGALPTSDLPPDRGATRLAYLDGNTSLLAVAPREFLDVQPNYEFDPLPPPQRDNIFTSQGTQLAWIERRVELQPQRTELEVRMRNLLAREGHIDVDEPDDGPDFDGGDGRARFLDDARFDDDDLPQRPEDLGIMPDSSPPEARERLLGALMRILGGDRGNPREAVAGGAEAAPQQETTENVPGAWPDGASETDSDV